MELLAIDGNPVPEGAIVGAVIAADGVKSRYARWRGAGRRAQGTVCILQGLGEAIEKYFETIEEFRKRGFAVATFDWRGQGGSDRRLRDATKAHVDSFAEYDRDFEAFVQQVVLPDCAPPYYALAHSLGGLIALRSARDGHSRFARMVLVAPLVGFGAMRPPEPVARRLAPAMTAIGLGELRVPGQAGETTARMPFAGNPLTGDAARFARNQKLAQTLPQLFVGAPTFGWFHAAFGAVGEAGDPDFAAAIKVPSLLVVGALDHVVSVVAVERFVSDMRTGGQVVIPGGRHELLMERDPLREQFFAAFDAFIPGS
ncbi:MAG: alpha/beta hydrolase [Bauldia sp.]